ncbi:MAG: asparagine synthase (glutamine-hydrolyzing) [bacterium]|nr:asparagine synthase (glutamine-hydrolyzing) [bacterium]
MCGITGLWSPDYFSDKDKKSLSLMADRLEHRGPDGRGFHIDEKAGIAMAHTRLSIIDLEGGVQPLYDREGRTVLTANGEFYDYKRMRGELVTEGFHFNTKSDSEIALKLYRKHGLDFVNHLRGEFAFVLFDEKKEELILVRDRFGIRPLFFHLTGKSIYYGSEIKALLAHHEISGKLSKKGMLHQMMQVMVPGDTLFEGIESLKPGHMMIIKRGKGGLKPKTICYWDADFPEKNAHEERSDGEQITKVREKMVESVALRLEADVPVACYLSGGIDSCSILGMASAIQQSPVKAFTISFDDDRYDESAIAQEMAEKCGADQDIMRVTASGLYGENFKKAVWHSERTFYNTLGVAKMMMSNHVTQNNYKVVITGEGSDEIFGGYAAFKQDMLLYGDSDREGRKKVNKDNNLFFGSILAERRVDHEALNDIVGFTPSWIQPWMLVLEEITPLLSDSFRDALEGYDPVGAIAESLNPSMLDRRHPLDKAQYTWMKTMLEGQILNWGGDRVDMANSLESRPAFLDHHVVENAINLPPHVRIRNGTEKWVLREAMKHILPEVLYKREKFAFMAPPAHTDQEKTLALNSLIHTFLTPEKVESLGLVDMGRLNSFLAQYRNDSDHTTQTRKDIILNHLITLHAIDEIFIEKNNML